VQTFSNYRSWKPYTQVGIEIARTKHNVVIQRQYVIDIQKKHV